MKKRTGMSAIIISWGIVSITGCGTEPTIGVTHQNSISVQKSSSSSPAPSQSSNAARSTTSSTARTSVAASHTANSPTVSVLAKTKRDAIVNLTYPQITGMSDISAQSRLNSYLSSISVPKDEKHLLGSDSASTSNSAPDDATDDESFTLVSHHGVLYDLLISSYVMPKGAAHGMPNEVSVIVNTKTGSHYLLPNVFASQKGKFTQLSNLVKQEDTRHTLTEFGPFTGVVPSDGLIMSDTGFIVYFSPYEWSSYAEGFPAYSLSLSELRSVPKAGGTFWTAYNTTLNSPDVLMQDIKKVESFKSQTDFEGGPLTASAYNMVTESPLPGGHFLYAIQGYASSSATSLDTVPMEKVFFFVDSRYLGTDTAKSHGPSYDVYPNGTGSVTVDYESSTSGANSFPITYHWDGSHLVPNKAFPSSYTLWGK